MCAGRRQQHRSIAGPLSDRIRAREERTEAFCPGTVKPPDVTEGDGGDGTEDTPASGDAAPNQDAPGTAVDEWQGLLATAGELTPAATDAIISTHGDRGRRAIEAVSEKRVKQYRDFTVVVGHHDEYIVEDGGCECADAAYNLDTADPEQRCWHAIAVDIAARIGAVDHHDMWYSEVREFL